MLSGPRAGAEAAAAAVKEGPARDAARDAAYLASIGAEDVAGLAGVAGALEKGGLLKRARGLPPGPPAR